jgi:hypothetical protein
VDFDAMGGKTINYAYNFRNDMDSMSEQSFLPDTLFADLPPSATVTLDEAYNGGSVIDVDDTNVDWRLTDTKEFIVSDSTGATKIFTVKALSAGDEVQIIGTLDMDGDVDGGTNKATFNSVEVGGAAGQVARTGGDLTLKTITSGDVSLESVADIDFATVRETGIALDDATAGAISGLFGQTFASISAAIKYAGENGGVDLSLGVYVHSGGSIAAGTNVPAVTSPVDYTSPHSFDMNTPAGVDTFIFFNGRLLYGGNGTTNNDVYPGTTPASGDLKFAFKIRNNDVVVTVQLAQ